MANNYFQFKQFTVYQDQCAMKVCTDACIAGAWASRYLSNNNISPKRLLDIGSGTGLLSLMLAQNFKGPIEGIEQNEQAVIQSRQNIKSSPCPNQIVIEHCRLQDFKPTAPYDFIISNPPFYEGDLLSPNNNRNAAKHHTALNMEELFHFIQQYITADGCAVVLLPYHRTVYTKAIARSFAFNIRAKLSIKQSHSHPFFRSVICFSKTSQTIVQESELSIHDENRNYTSEFITLMKDFYLKF